MSKLLSGGPNVSFSVRYAIEPLIIRRDDVIDMSPIAPPLQGLTIEGLDNAGIVMKAPIRIDGKWFVPAPRSEADELERRWHNAAPK